jgi:hypothetical protein
MFPSPTITPPTLNDFEYYFNGLHFGAETPFGVLGVEGLDLAEIRSGDISYPRDYGQFKGLDLFAGKDIIFDFWEKSNGVSLQSSQLELATATNIMPDEEFPLWFQLPNLPILCVFCRVRKRPTKIDSDYAAANIAKPELVLHATDPRIYSAGKETAAIKLVEPAAIVLECQTLIHSKVVKTASTATLKVGDHVVFASVIAPGTVIAKIINETEFELSAEAEATHSSPEVNLKFYGPASETVEVDNEGNTEMREIIVFTGPLARPRLTSTELEGEPYLEVISPEREEKEEAAATIRTEELNTKKAAWEAVVANYEKEREIYEAAKNAKAAKESKEKAEAAKIAGEKEDKEFIEAGEVEHEKESHKYEKEELEGVLLTVQAGDQVVLNTGVPRLASYYPGGVSANKPEPIMGWVSFASTWFDLPPGTSKLKLTAYNVELLTGTATAEYASAYEL